MNKALGAALLVVGVILVIYGINASDSVASEVSEAFSGSPTDKTIWLLAGGALLGVVGLVFLLGSGRRTTSLP